MIPATFSSFFAASTGAGAALIGLLFVAVSISPETTAAKDAPLQRRVASLSAFTALANAFFISLIALVPGSAVGIAAVILGVSELLANLAIGLELVTHRRAWEDTRQAILFLPSCLLLYGLEVVVGVLLARNPDNLGALTLLVWLAVGYFVWGLSRSWQLVIGYRSGFAASFLHIAEQANAAVRREPGEPAETRATDAVEVNATGESATSRADHSD